MKPSTATITTRFEGDGRVMTRDEAEAFGDRELVAVAPTLLATARYLSRSEADAADLVQATLEIALRRRSQLRDPARLRSWLLAIETREAFRLRRRLRALVSLDGSVLEVPAVGGPSDADLEVRMAVAKLPTRMRAAVVLHHMASLSVTETAEAMQVSENTVKTLLRLGLVRLREVLA
jgi:RNA polymerase sigma-70 factor (ECF subfamily)